MPDELLETSVAARLLGLTPGAVRLLNKQGRLEAATRTIRGQHLYARSVVENLAEERRKRATAAPKQPVTAVAEAVSPDLAVKER
jgi:DNA-binding transcriptional MerR regulator